MMRPRSLRPQRGVAIITALLVVVLAAGIATYLLAQQSHALTRTARATARAQAGLYAGPTLDWARAVLADAQKSTYVSSQQPWAQGIVAQPIDSALASGVIHDETAKFNLNNLVLQNGNASPGDVAIFKRLLTELKLNPELADAVIDWIDPDSQANPGGAEDSYYMSLPKPYRAANRPLVQWQELARVRGFDNATMQRLAPFATALRGRTAINLNTAPVELIAALFPNLAAADVTNVVNMREVMPFKDLNDIKTRVPNVNTTTVNDFTSVTSSDFLVSIAIDSDSTQVRQTALLHRESAPKWPSIIWLQTQ